MNRICYLFGLIITLVSLQVLAASNVKFNKIIFFGDSLSDNGNLYRQDYGYLPNDPPYFQGRFSNGMTWAERFAYHYADENSVSSYNYAVGGETVRYHNPWYGYLPYTLNQSYDDFVLRNYFGDHSNTLFVFFIGANDYLTGLDDVNKDTTSVVDGVESVMQALISRYNARYFLLMNLPDMSHTPYAQTDKAPKNLHEISELHNRKLSDMITKIRTKNPGTQFELYSIEDLFKSLLSDPSQYNNEYHVQITDTTTSCWKGGYTTAPTKPMASGIALSEENAILTNMKSYYSKLKTNRVTLNALSRNDNIINVNQTGFAATITHNPALLETYLVSTGDPKQLCDNPDNHIFWDHVHPTRVMHKIIASELITFTDNHFSKK